MYIEQVKITEEGQRCRKCNTPVIKRAPKKTAESKKSILF